MSDASRKNWPRILLALAALPVVCCVTVVVGMCVRPRDEDFVVRPGLEPVGTFAIEGRLRGDTATGDGPEDFTVVLNIDDEATGTRGGGLFRGRSADRTFRVAGLPCPHAQSMSISVQTDDGRGGVLHASLGGNIPRLYATSRDRLANVQIDLSRAWSFRGTARDAQTGAPLEGVTVSAAYQTYGRDGWSLPQEFTRSNARGEWLLHGVTSGRFADARRPEIKFYLHGYQDGRRPVPVPANGAIPTVDLTLSR